MILGEYKVQSIHQIQLNGVSELGSIIKWSLFWLGSLEECRVKGEGK